MDIIPHLKKQHVSKVLLYGYEPVIFRLQVQLVKHLILPHHIRYGYITKITGKALDCLTAKTMKNLRHDN